MSWEMIGLWAGIMLPLWDIPLIVRILRRKSASDISLWWIGGLWLSSVLMAPSAFVVHNVAAIAFNMVNVLMLTIVLIVVVKYHRACPAGRQGVEK